MARGINQRTALGLSESDMQDPARLGRLVKQWGDGLPFGSVGFEASRSNAQSIGIGTTLLAFNEIVRDYEGWFTSTSNPFNQFVVPPGCSGLYLIKSDVAIVNGRQTFSAGGVNGGAGFITPLNTTNTLASIAVTGCQVGDQIIVDCGVTVASAGAGGSVDWLPSVTDPVTTTPMTGFFVSGNVPAGTNVPITFRGIFTVVNAGTNTIIAKLRQQTGTTAITWAGFTVTYTRASLPVGSITNVVTVNGLCVYSVDISQAPAGIAQAPLVWLNDGDIIQNKIISTVAATTAVQAQSATQQSLPRFVIARVSLL